MSVRIVIPDDFPPAYAGRPELEELRKLGEVTLYGDRADTREELVQRLAGADAAINVRAYTRFDEELFAALPRLKHVAIFGVGTDNFDLDAATRHGVIVSNCPGENARSVAELAIALMLAVARTIPAYDRDVRAGLWKHYHGIELEGKTLGVLGLGSIGRHVARMGAGLGMKVVAWSPTRDEARAAALSLTQLELGGVLRQADVLQVCVALSERTRGLIGERQFALMKPGAILVNTARAPIVDEPALIAALQSGRLRGAGLDVFASEPLAPDSPLRALENVVLTPHAGWVTTEASARLLIAPVRNLANWLAGQPTNVVNPAALARTTDPAPSPNAGGRERGNPLDEGPGTR
ncbi:MAG TPA: hydroxyacid dehydrogenase [Dehalococcoidia bacterium]|nr:hydroxyacid dehydrogenase [Dehalococcoidia bacterium]